MKLAILDLYDGTPNQGMRCIKDMVARYEGDLEDWKVFDVRGKNEVPDLSYDIFISTGGPGNPLEGDGVWDKNYYNWLDSVWSWNQKNPEDKKHVFFICHSFQMMVNHFDLAKITLLAARSIHQRHGHVSVLYDGLRTIEAQSLMASSPIARANPHWLEQPNRLLSPPGGGAHPRGMAIDLSLIDEDGKMLDMGTVFDHLAEDPSPAHNPAHRDYIGLTDEVRQNRAILTGAMIDAAAAFDMPLLPLPQEWWDFRFTAEYYGGFAPLSDENLPPEMRMTQICTAGDSPANLSDSHFDALKDSVERDVNQRLD